MTTRTRAFALSLFAAAAMATSGAQAADEFSFGGTGATGVSFSGMVTYDPLAAFELTITLTNTTSSSIGGFLTGLAFDLPEGTSITGTTSTHPDMTLVSGPSVAPFGTRGWAMAVGGNWLGGGKPSGGIAAGSEGTFSFDLTNAPDSLTLGDLNMVARFRGYADSDKVPAVPEPEGWALMAAGLAALGAIRRRRRDAAPLDAAAA